MSYKKVGGLHFIKIGRFGASFYASKPIDKPVRYTLSDTGSNLLLATMALAIFFGV